MRTAAVFLLSLTPLVAGDDEVVVYRAEMRRLDREEQRFWKGYLPRENAAKAAALAAWKPPIPGDTGPFGCICDHAEYERMYAEAEALGAARGAAAAALARSGHAKALDTLFGELLRLAARVEEAEAEVWGARPGGAWGGTSQRHGILRHGLDAWWRGLVEALANVPGGAAWLATAGYEQAARKDGNRSCLRRVAVVDALGAGGDVAARPFLEQTLGAEATWLRIAAVEALARHGSVGPLAARLADPSPVVRRALLAEARTRGRGVAEWVRPLLAAYRAAEGQLRADCVAALEAVTGRAFGDEPARWEAWHAEHAPALDTGRLDVGDGAADRATARPGLPAFTFYGIPSPSRSVVFVLDGSENLLMPADVALQATRHHADWWTGKGGWRKDHVTHEALEKRELAKALAALPDDAAFGVVLPGTAVKTVPVERATVAHRRTAERLLDGHAPGGWRSELDNLVAAMDLAGLRPMDVPDLPDPRADTVLVVCDGSILAGRYEAPTALLAAFGRLNRFRRLVVHVVHICNAGEYSGKLLRELAEMTGGTYRRVLKPPP